MRPCYQVAVASDMALPSLAGSLFEEIGESDPEIKLLQHQLEHAQRQIAGLEAEVAGLKRAINSILHSHSWHATRPLRAVANLLRAITGKHTETEP